MRQLDYYYDCFFFLNLINSVIVSSFKVVQSLLMFHKIIIGELLVIESNINLYDWV